MDGAGGASDCEAVLPCCLIDVSRCSTITADLSFALSLCKENETKDLCRDTTQLSFVGAIIERFIIKAVQRTCWKEKFKQADAAGWRVASNPGA